MHSLRAELLKWVIALASRPRGSSERVEAPKNLGAGRDGLLVFFLGLDLLLLLDGRLFGRRLKLRRVCCFSL
jgi:hypothetical protein